MKSDLGILFSVFPPKHGLCFPDGPADREPNVINEAYCFKDPTCLLRMVVEREPKKAVPGGSNEIASKLSGA